MVRAHVEAHELEFPAASQRFCLPQFVTRTSSAAPLLQQRCTIPFCQKTACPEFIFLCRRDESAGRFQRRSTAGLPPGQRGVSSGEKLSLSLTLRAGRTSSKSNSARRKFGYTLVSCAVGFVLLSAFGISPFEESAGHSAPEPGHRPGFGVLGIDESLRKLREAHVERVGAMPLPAAAAQQEAGTPAVQRVAVDLHGDLKKVSLGHLPSPVLYPRAPSAAPLMEAHEARGGLDYTSAGDTAASSGSAAAARLLGTQPERPVGEAASARPSGDSLKAPSEARNVVPIDLPGVFTGNGGG